MIIDTHCHLADSVFDEDREAVLERARTADVRAVVSVAESLADCRKNLEMAAAHPGVFAGAGLHPSQADRDVAESVVALIRAERDRLCCIGEIGLDYWLAKQDDERSLQRDILIEFIRLSSELALPLNLHSRSAGAHTVSLLLEHGAEKVHLHAFDGKATSAWPGVEAGYFFSVPPSIVRSRQKQKLVRQLPLDCLMVETDSPVLGPDPRTRNEPANANAAVGAIADIKNLPRRKVAEAVHGNSVRLYGKSTFAGAGPDAGTS